MFKRCLLRRLHKFDHYIDVFTREPISFGKLLQDSCNLAEALHRYGCDLDTNMSICSENTVQFFIPIIASLYIGSPICPINSNYTVAELRHALDICQPRIIFCTVDTAQKLVELKKELPYVEKIVVINGDRFLPGVDLVQDFVCGQLRGRNVDPSKFRPYNGNAVERVAFILLSSGTTGMPKGVMTTHRNVVTRLAQSRDPRFDVDMGNIVVAILPLSHCYGLQAGLVSIYNHIKVVVLRKFDEDVFLKTIEDHRVTKLWVAPPLCVFLAKTPKISRYDLTSLKSISTSASPLSKDIEVELTKRLDLDEVRQAYGATELTMGALLFPNNDIRVGSSGKVVANVKAKVRDPESGKTLGPNQVGELCFKGPSVMKGYYKNAKATKEVFTEDGWLRSGDLGYYDDEKYFFVVDRLKELIKYKGYQVPPAELESVLLSHPKVLDAGVVGLPDEIAGELPLAFVVRQIGMDISETELVDFVKESVSAPKWLRGGVIFVSTIPKNPSGKILRRVLKQWLAEKITMKSKL